MLRVEIMLSMRLLYSRQGRDHETWRVSCSSVKLKSIFNMAHSPLLHYNQFIST
jgi:hypothetical protein